MPARDDRSAVSTGWTTTPLTRRQVLGAGGLLVVGQTHGVVTRRGSRPRQPSCPVGRQRG